MRRKLARFACVRRPKLLHQGNGAATTAFVSTNQQITKMQNKCVEALVLFPGEGGTRHFAHVERQ
eukprot:4105738-Pyramimonas_sp.AAC.1